MRILSFDVGVVNLAYCIFDSSDSKIKNWEVITLQNHNDYNNLYINLITELDTRKSSMINDIDVVLIEKQPSFNPKMRIVAGCLQTYFIIRGIIDNVPPSKPIKAVKFFSPKHKLKCYNGPDIVLESKAKGKYARTKKTGVAICEYKLREYSETKEICTLFNESKKKDDLSDCYLQAITYAMFEKLIDSTTVRKVKLPKAPKKTTKGITKSQIKKELVDYFETLTEKINDIPETVKVKICIHDLEEIKKLMGTLNMKRFMKNFN